jgi:chromosome segregation ATPase
MTPNQLQLLLKELFDKLSAVSTELSAAKDKLVTINKELVIHEEDVKGAKENYFKVKESKVTNLDSFKTARNYREEANNSIGAAKSRKAKIERNIEELTKTKDSIKAQYEATDRELKKALNNVEVLYAK